MRKRLRKKKLKRVADISSNDIISDLKWDAVQHGKSCRYINTNPLPEYTIIKGAAIPFTTINVCLYGSVT
jgi:hypothetical protein